MLKSILATLSLSILFATPAMAHIAKPFSCTSKLDYVVWKNGQPEIKTVDFKLDGARSETNTLSGGAFVQVGHWGFQLNLPRETLSDSIVILEGTNTKDQASLSFVFMKNSDGSYNLSNKVSVSVRHFGELITASNEILSTEDTSDDYPIVCTIE